MYTVYMHITPNGKRYIGITSTDVIERWGKDGSGYSKQLFGRAIKKYGWNNIEHKIIAVDLTQEEAEQLEISLIKRYNTTNHRYGYNCAYGGKSCSGFKWNDTSRKKLSMAKLGNKSRTGMHNSLQHIESCRKAHIGNNYGSLRHITDEYRLKAKLNQPYRQVIQQYSLDGRLIADYNSIHDAQKITGIWNIGAAANGRIKSHYAGGYIWKRKGN